MLWIYTLWDFFKLSPPSLLLQRKPNICSLQPNSNQKQNSDKTCCLKVFYSVNTQFMEMKILLNMELYVQKNVEGKMSSVIFFCLSVHCFCLFLFGLWVVLFWRFGCVIFVLFCFVCSQLGLSRSFCLQFHSRMTSGCV